MSAYSEEELVQWLKEESKMFDWGMIAVMDRAKANRLLIQEYIRHFQDGSYLAPQSGEVTTGGSWRNTIENALLDVPRLSFENANLQNAKARLHMAMVSGNRVRLEKQTNWEVRRIDQYGPQQRPELDMDLELSNVPGNVGEDGSIYLDLKDCSAFSFGFAGSSDEQTDMGAFFKNKFEALDDEKRIYRLGRIEQGDNELLRPDRFLLRTQARDPQAKDGDGAVISFIRMEGDQDGSLPTSSDTFRYLIPKDADKDYSAAVAVVGERIALVQLTQSLQKSIEGARFENRYEDIGTRRVVVGADLTQGQLSIPGVGERVIEFEDALEGMSATYKTGDIVCDLSDNLEIRLLPGGKGIVVKGGLNGSVPFRFKGIDIGDWDDQQKPIATLLINAMVGHLFAIEKLPYEYAFEATYILDDVRGELQNVAFDITALREPTLPPVRRPPGEWDDPEFPGFEDIQKLIAYLLLGLAGMVAKMVAEVQEVVAGPDLSLGANIEDALNKSFAVSASIDDLIDKTIKLNFNNAILRDKTRIPRDVVAFGKVNPTLTRFVVDDLEPVLAAGQKKTFRTVPARSDVVWSVEPEGCGNIDPKTGEYTAPVVDDIDGSFIRARVIARAKDAESSALVTVVRHGLMLNPLVVTTWLGSEVELQAGALGAVGNLEWRIENADPHGSFKTPGASTANMTYVAHPQGEYPPKAFYIDEVSVHEPDTGERRTMLIIIKDNNGPALTVSTTIDADSPSLTLKAIEYIDDVTEYTDWVIRQGPGKLEDNRYIADETSSEPFAVITAAYIDGRRTYEGLVIVPLPLSKNNRALAALCKEAC
ncbi:hypothetical protein K8374_06595 [Pseudomonas sp. p1(2021b)]|uniref:hypothetical protein n=1 Tax=Pseudomonas sp. p1(2021b) TaxID=2874628 RepID=UPI001CCC007E|nr:hypothetical protein [Pseudomonas sp. p1(2021b)]UBM26638.1 hypothetical protein K8374_06595 [Pseudomonas sp. p1(2021b)]